MTEREVNDDAPLAPGCFPSRMTWVQYLVSAQEIKTKATKPFTRGRFNPAFNFCADCTYEHRAAMHRAGRCRPPTAATTTREEACD